MTTIPGDSVSATGSGSSLAGVAYFSMEIGLDTAIPTYSGGLGVLAGDTLRSAADLGIPMIGVTLLYRKGYFRQFLSIAGQQAEHPAEWTPEDLLDRMDAKVSIEIEGRSVAIGCWRVTAISRRVKIRSLGGSTA